MSASVQELEAQANERVNTRLQELEEARHREEQRKESDSENSHHVLEAELVRLRADLEAHAKQSLEERRKQLELESSRRMQELEADLVQQHRVSEAAALTQRVEDARKEWDLESSRRLQDWEAEMERQRTVLEAEFKERLDTRLLESSERSESRVRELEAEASKGSDAADRLTAQLQGMHSERDALLAEVDSLRDQVKSLESLGEASKSTLTHELNQVQHQFSESIAKTTFLEERISGLLVDLESARQQISSSGSSADEKDVELARVRAEAQMATARFGEAQAALDSERHNRVAVESQLMQAQLVIDDLKGKLHFASAQLSAIDHGRTDTDVLHRERDKYLKVIHDVTVVLGSTCDKYMSPNSSLAGSRAHSVEDSVGIEAIASLEKNVRSVLRMIDNVFDKVRMLERDNLKIEHRLSETEELNTKLRDRLNQPFMQRLIEPIISCRWPGGSTVPTMISSGPTVTRVTQRTGNEMSQLLSPPSQHPNLHADHV